MNVSACIATRGDVDMQPILDSLPDEWEKNVWDNSRGWYSFDAHGFQVKALAYPRDLGPHGRFAAIEYASHDLIYVQDDDVIVSDPEAMVEAWYEHFASLQPTPSEYAVYDHDIAAGDVPFVVCNMPQEFRPHYHDSAMVGFGAAFHRDAPKRAFDELGLGPSDPLFLRESCRAFTVLTPRVLVDVPVTNMPYASDANRLWKQPGHVASRERMLALARECRDAR